MIALAASSDAGFAALGGILQLLFIANVAVEVVVSAAISRSVRVVLALLALNLVTFPAAIVAIGEGAHWIAAEVAVFVCEAIGLAWLTELSARRSALVAAAANGVTVALALGLTAFAERAF